MNRFDARSPGGTPPAVPVDGDGPPIAATGGPVVLFGHSYGANCAVDGAALTRSVARLVLYEPSLGTSYPPGALDAIEASIAAADLDAAAVAVLSLIGMSEAEIEGLRPSENPHWATPIASAWTLPREARVEEGWTYRPGQIHTIEASTLVLAGSDPPPDVAEPTRRAAGAIPGPRIRVLDDHGHMAHKTDPILVADLLRTFVSTGVLA